MSQSRASRVRQLQRQMKRPGRPVGSRASLLANPKRFAIAVQRALDGLDIAGPYDRGALVTLLIEENTPISIEAIDNVLVAVSARYHEPAMTTFESRVDRLVRDARALPMKVNRREAEWFAVSIGCVQAVIIFAANENVAGVKRAIEMLHAAGWVEIIARLQARLAAALRGNVPPFDETGLGRRGRRLLTLLSQRESLK